MYKGQIKKTWLDSDYLELPWTTSPTPEEKLTATVETTDYNIGVAVCNEQLPQVFYDVLKNFNIDKPVVAVNKMVPGQVLPYHKDRFAEYKRRNNISNDDSIVRYIVFLHDQKAGHQLWIEDQVCTGSAGCYFGWDDYTIHMAANLGWEDRYILQITGIKK